MRSFGKLKIDSEFWNHSKILGKSLSKRPGVYFLNDHGAALKKAINKATGSAIVEI